MSVLRTSLTAFLVTLFSLSSASNTAHAQVHVDVGAQAGLMKRFLTSRDPNGSDAGFGPAFELRAHVAILPMLRGGIYVAHDISPISGEPARQITSGGVQARFLPPLVRSESYYTYLAAGFGYATTYAPSFHSTQPNLQQPGTTLDVAFGGDSGRYFEVPLALGMAWKLTKPWVLTAELGGRIGFASSGAVYDGRTASATGVPLVTSYADGNDTFALSLSVGIQLDL